MQPLGCMRQEVAMLVNRARWTGTAFHTAAITASRPGAPSTTRNSGRCRPRWEIIEHRPPGFGTFPTHGLDREQELLTVGAHPDDDEQRDCGRFAIEPHPHHRAVEDQLHNRFLRQ